MHGHNELMQPPWNTQEYQGRKNLKFGEMKDNRFYVIEKNTHPTDLNDSVYCQWKNMSTDFI